MPSVHKHQSIMLWWVSAYICLNSTNHECLISMHVEAVIEIVPWNWSGRQVRREWGWMRVGSSVSTLMSAQERSAGFCGCTAFSSGHPNNPPI